MKMIRCPHCQREIEWSERWPQRPFCSERCRLIDLGAWADETYRISGGEKPRTEKQDEDLGQELIN